jgi:hypothetical protein
VDFDVNTLKGIQAAAAFVAAGGALAAAVFWLWASLTKLPPMIVGGYDHPLDQLAPVEKALQASARRNALGALFACIAALASLIGFLVQMRLDGIL